MTAIAHVLIAPIVTEKSVAIAGKYVFRVHNDATKSEIATAVKEFYKVEADNVNIIRLKGKTRTVGRGRIANKRSPFKKAIVTLKDGKTLNFNDFK